MLFFLGPCSSQSLINVTLQFCNPSHTFFIKTLPTLLSTDDFPRVSSELLQILKFFNLVINCLAVRGFTGSSSESPGIAACNDIADSWQ